MQRPPRCKRTCGLHRTRWFITVLPKYRRTDKGLVLVLSESSAHRPQRGLPGANQIKPKKLAEETGLKIGSPYDISANKEAAKRLETFYHDNRYTEATVDLVKGDKPQDRDVVFRVHEGPRQQVVWRTFIGNNSVSGERLAMELKSQPAYVWIGGAFDPNNLVEDVAAIRRYYADLGFFDATAKPAIQYSKDRKSLTLV